MIARMNGLRSYLNVSSLAAISRVLKQLQGSYDDTTQPIPLAPAQADRRNAAAARDAGQNRAGETTSG
jgi:hypothetical protein